MAETSLALLDISPPEVIGHKFRRSNEKFEVKSVSRTHANVTVLLTPNLTSGFIVLEIGDSNTLTLV